MLWACLLFPSLPLDVFARASAPADAARPFVVGSGGHYPRIVAINAAALAAGIRPGQLVSAALALAPELVLRDRDPDAEARALAQLATWTATFTPGTHLAPPDAVLADIGGSLRLFGGLPPLIARLASDVQAQGYAMRLGVAPTPGAALLLARAGDPRPLRDPAQLAATLAPLPLALVDLDAATLRTLAEAGITTFGAAAALPRDGLARRFGAGLVATLDRALGRIPDPRPPFVPPPRFASCLELPAPVHDVEALQFGVHRLVQELSAWLTARGLGVVRLTLTLAHERYLRQRGLPATTITFALGAPARLPAHLLAVLRERLARLALPAPVEAITLTSAETAPLSGRNLGLLPGDEALAVEVPLLERLRARLGEHAVTRVAVHAEHRPERAQRDEAISALATTAQVRTAGQRPPSARGKSRAATASGKRAAPGTIPSAAMQGTRPAPGATPATTQETFPASSTIPSAATRGKHATPGVAPTATEASRPLWLLAEPQPLARLLETQPWVLRDGPERIESGWWDGGDVRRDYFVATAPTGETTWIYRDHRHGVDDGEWFLHGFFA